MTDLFIAFRGKHLVVSEAMDKHIRATFPGCDVVEQYLLADLWLEANPSRRWRNQMRGLAQWLTKHLRHAPKVAAEVRVGTAPKAEDYGVTLRPEVVERMKARFGR